MQSRLKKIARKLGYKKDQEGIMRRFINEEGAWKNHLSNTKKFIESHLNHYNTDKVAILGSGWLLDVPLDHLTKHFKQVHLYDICHPLQVIHKVRKNDQIKLFEFDLSGNLCSYLYDNRKEIKKTPSAWLKYLKIEKNVSFNGYDLVISLNILNQIDMLIADYIKSIIHVNNKDLNELRKLLQEFHLNCLPKNKSIIISDIEEQLWNENGNLTSVSNLLYAPLTNVKIQEKWIWQFDNHYTYHEDFKTTFKVIAATK